MSEGHKVFEGFWSHLTELIKRMKVVLATFLIALFVMLVLPGNTDLFGLTNNYKPLMSVLLVDIAKMFLPPDVQLFAGSMSDPITLYVYAALVFAIGITLPVFAYEAYRFIDPTLYPNERKSIFPFVSVVTVLFVVGSLFGFSSSAFFCTGLYSLLRCCRRREIVPDNGFLQHCFLHRYCQRTSVYDSSVLCSSSKVRCFAHKISD